MTQAIVEINEVLQEAEEEIANIIVRVEQETGMVVDDIELGSPLYKTDGRRLPGVPRFVKIDARLAR